MSQNLVEYTTMAAILDLTLISPEQNMFETVTCLLITLILFSPSGGRSRPALSPLYQGMVVRL